MSVSTNQNLSARNGDILTLRLNLSPRTLLLLLAFCEKNIVRYIVHVVNMLPIISYVSGFIVPCAYIVLFGLCLWMYADRISISWSVILVPVFVVFAVLGTYVFYPDNMIYFLQPAIFWNTVFPCLRWYLVGLAIIPDEKTMNMLGKASCLAVLVESAFVILYMIPRGMTSSDDMSRSYQLLPNILLVFNYAINKKKLIPWLFAAMGLVYTLSLGTRGPLVIIAAYFVIKIALDADVKKWIKVTLVVGFALLMLTFTSSRLGSMIIEVLYKSFNSLGLSTRILEFMIDGSLISNTTGRDDIFVRSLELIWERPFLGYGVYGEWKFFNWNAHNLYLEFLLHYGIPLGGALLIWLISQVHKAYVNNPNKHAKDVILVYVPFVFVRGFFGGSYLNLGVFFLLAFCLQEIRRKRAALRLLHSVRSEEEENAEE